MKPLFSLVTGGASGLGKATVERLVKEGSKVIFLDLPTSKGQEVAETIGSSSVKFVPADVASEKDVTNAVNVIKESFGKLDVIVNCAAISVSFQTYNFHKNTAHHLDDFNRVLNVNVSGTFNVIRLAVGLIANNTPDKDGLRGVVINTSAFSAYDATSGQIAFAASKAAIAGMTLPLARDFATQGIRVCAIAPGLFNTPLNSYLPEKICRFLSESTLSPRRFGEPSEFADLVMCIINNPFLNAANIRLDGGFRML